MNGKYNVGIDHIRSLAITCHALDGQFDKLFNAGAICGNSQKVVASYDQLLSVSLLNLAIFVRVALSNEPAYRSATSGATACGLFETGAPEKDGGFSIKDVCDKLIHADNIFKPVEPGVEGACCRLRGTYREKPWEFSLGVSIFSEIVLKWLDDIEKEKMENRKRKGK